MLGHGAFHIGLGVFQGGVGAKELVISSLRVTCAQEGEEELTTEEDSEETALQRALTASIPTAAALAFMVFVLLYFPCIATFVAIKNDTGKWRWTILLCRYTTLVAWICSFAAYRIGLLIW